MASAGEVWASEARIVPAEEEPSSSSVSTTVSTEAFLNRVGANYNSIAKTEKDRATITHFREQIRKGHEFQSTLHLDAGGNVIGADGRHRAIAALLEGKHRISVVVTRRHG